MRVAGTSIKAGSLFIAVLDWDDGGPGTPVLLSSVRLQPNTNLGSVEEFTDFRDRVRQFLAAQNLGSVALMETRKFAQLSYGDAYARIMKVCALMDATNMLRLPFSIETTTKVGRTLKLKPTSLQTFQSSRVGLEARPTYWSTGLSEAAAVSMHLLGDPAAPQQNEAKAP